MSRLLGARTSCEAILTQYNEKRIGFCSVQPADVRVLVVGALQIRMSTSNDSSAQTPDESAPPLDESLVSPWDSATVAAVQVFKLWSREPDT